MKICRFENRIVLVGKAWEIRAKLKEYARQYALLQDWINDRQP
ncbi:Z-ring formation inhibitor MciZ [Metabacillus sp. GX 13764]|nr:Z-ring formation inhibitor MciZ [Metabacillus kandeliae]MCD7033278.1 Z-ring formation inhibitor MciZ [Metabacillus kandeliae]